MDNSYKEDGRRNYFFKGWRVRYMKKVYVVIGIVLILMCSVVQANEMRSIDMNVFIDENGNANVTETWQYYSDSGTECYHSYKNLGNSKIENLVVSDDTMTYEILDGWDVNGSFEDKKYKCGINNTSDGTEICWGISEYGNKEYVVNYVITDFVSELEDSQVVYWELIPQGTATQEASITIWSELDYEDTLPVWGYGNYGGFCYVADGKIEMKSDGALDDDEYMTILVKFPKGTFNCADEIGEDFEYYYDLSIKDAKKYEEGDTVEFIAAIFTVIIIGVFSICGVAVATQEKVKIETSDIKSMKSAPFYRDIPCGGNVERAFYISTLYRLTNKDADLFGALLLKWLKKDIISIQPASEVDIQKARDVYARMKAAKEKGMVLEDTADLNDFDNQEVNQIHNMMKVVEEKRRAIILKSTGGLCDFDSQKERDIYNMMREASKDDILSQGEFEEWCNKNYNKIFKWLENVKKEERDKLVNEGKIIKLKKNKYQAESTLTKDAMELAGLKRFLKEYTLIKERTPIEVKMFEEYLIYAQIFGIAKEVQKAFKDLYPDIVAESCYSTYDNINFIYMYSNSAMESVARAQANAYSSGGGGFSSGGGGGGSFGGGGSMGSR